MLSSLEPLMHGWPGLALAYGAVQAPMLAGMMQARAALSRLALSPLLAAPVTVAAGIGIALATPLLPGLAAAPSSLVHLTLGGFFSAGLGYASGRLFGRATAEASIHRRGALVVVPGEQREASRVQERAVRAEAQPLLHLAGRALALSDEVKHFKFIGATGSGKSTAIAQLLGEALRRGDRAVIADPDGGYMRRFFEPRRGDVILNPFDARSMKWDPFAEIRAPYDAEQLARSLIPDHEGADRSWRGYARTFFAAVTQQAHAAGVRDAGELYRLLVLADRQELRTLTGGTPAQPFLDEYNLKMFDSIRSVTSAAVGALGYVAAQRAPRFSVRDWIAQERGDRRGVLFIPYRAGQIAALRSTISAWMRIGIFEAMERSEGDQRLWFVIDELDALGQIDGLKDALARLRKFGGRCVLGFQSIAQVAATYGEGDAQTIVENCGNTLILRCSASDGGGTSRFASTLIGQREVLRTSLARSRRASELVGSITRSEHLAIEPAVLDSEIEQLPDLSAYLKLASRPEWLRVRLSAAHPAAEASTRAFAQPSEPTLANRACEVGRTAAAIDSAALDPRGHEP